MTTFRINKDGRLSEYLFNRNWFVWRIEKVLWFYLITYKK
jgi:hypothetical protein